MCVVRYAHPSALYTIIPLVQRQKGDYRILHAKHKQSYLWYFGDIIN